MNGFPDDLPIIDAHHHLWDLRANYYPWLTDQVATRVCGEYSAIRKDYLLPDFRKDIGDLPVVATVHVEAAHDRSDPVRETAWLHAVAGGSPAANPGGFPNGLVVYCDLSRPDAPQVLERHLAFPNVRGVRQMLHEALIDPGRPSPPLYEDAVWRANLEHAGGLGLSFDLQLLPEQMAAGASVAAAHPGLGFVLCHTGQPLRRDPEGIEAWRSGMRDLARLDNVTVKISGLGMFDRAWTVDSIRPFVLETIEIFGPRRAMFASNFPVDGMMSSYRRLWQAYEVITRGFAPDERRLLFAETARRVYRL
jgi:predicted TIM-barrel fold metal-dependent hydrolase